MKTRMGTTMSAETQRVRLMASSGRRISSPHLPPEQYCTISNARPPSEKPQQSMKPISQERIRWLNPSCSINSASTTSITARMLKTAPKVSARRRHAAIRAAGAARSPVRARVAFACAFVTWFPSSVLSSSSLGPDRPGLRCGLLSRRRLARSSSRWRCRRAAEGHSAVSIRQLNPRMPAGVRRPVGLSRRHRRSVPTRWHGIDGCVRHLPWLGVAGRQTLLPRDFAQLLHSHACRDVALLRILAQLQCTDVRGDSPAVRRRHLRGVVRHGAVSVGDHIEIVAQRLCQPLGIVEVAGRLVAALDDHARAVAHTRVTRRAVGIELFLAALQDRQSGGEGQRVHFFSVLQSGVEEVGLLRLPARHRVRYLVADGTAIREKGRAALGEELRLILHILAATGNQHQCGRSTQPKALPQPKVRGAGTILAPRVNTPPPRSRPDAWLRDRPATPREKTSDPALQDTGRACPRSLRYGSSAR